MKPTIILAVLLVISPSCHAQQQAAHVRFYKSKTFWAMFSLTSAAMVADYATSQRAFARGAVEANPLFGGPKPSMLHMTAIGLPFQFGASYLGFKMSRSKRWIIRDLCWAAPLYEATGHSYNAVRNTAHP
jgi:hypothetical protein